jgi:DNA polymerase/3'-5' exonuclease PolX
MNFKEKIISELEIMLKKEQIEKNVFKVKAYAKVIKELKNKEGPIEKIEDILNISGIGKKIKDKIIEIIDTGKLNAAERVRETVGETIKTYDILLSIYGIGTVMAKKLVEEHKVKTIKDLIELNNQNPKILNDNQKIGLKYYKDLNKRIPRQEMEEHDKYIHQILNVSDFKNLQFEIVGSYRRKAENSGDIDILVSLNKKSTELQRTKIFKNIINKLKENYIIGELANGDKKFMGVVKLNENLPARRLDILITSCEEYPFALLYFTGSANINVEMRKEAIKKGLRLNEYSLISIESKRKRYLKNEQEIFEYLGFEYLEPQNRKK